MSELIDFYQQLALAKKASDPLIASIQNTGVKDFGQKSFPTRHDEDWKYSAPDAFLKYQFGAAKSPSQGASSCYKPHEGYCNLSLVNGELDLETLHQAKLPQGVMIQSLSTMAATHPELIRPYLGQLLKHEDGFQALNTAMLNHGVVIYLADGIVFDEPIVLKHWQNQAENAVYLRHLIIAEAGAKATIIEDYSGVDDLVYSTNTVTEIFVSSKASIDHYKVQRESLAAFHYGHVWVHQGEESSFKSHSFSFGGRWVRSDLTNRLSEQNAYCLMNGLYIPGHQQHVDHHTRIYHDTVSCESNQDYKGILLNQSRAVFNGQVHVAPGAQHTKANQQNKNILLSPDAEIDTKPQLEIFANDVICTHGATVGQLDEDAKFYLQSRGLDSLSVMTYLIQAFIASNVELIDDLGMKSWLLTLIDDKLKNL